MHWTWSHLRWAAKRSNSVAHRVWKSNKIFIVEKSRENTTELHISREIYFTIFLVKLKCNSARQCKTVVFSRLFFQQKWDFFRLIFKHSVRCARCRRRRVKSKSWRWSVRWSHLYTLSRNRRHLLLATSNSSSAIISFWPRFSQLPDRMLILTI